jgi:anti-anti-sigma factor
MELVETEVGGVRIATVEGRLDSATAPTVEQSLLDMVNRGDMVLDMGGLGYVSSAGLRILLKGAKAAKAAGHRFLLCNMQETVLEIFRISRFDTILTAYPTRAEALAVLA